MSVFIVTRISMRFGSGSGGPLAVCSSPEKALARAKIVEQAGGTAFVEEWILDGTVVRQHDVPEAR